jgi:hypothetical protein
MSTERLHPTAPSSLQWYIFTRITASEPRFFPSCRLVLAPSPGIILVENHESTSKIHLLFVGDFGNEGSAKDECIGILGSTADIVLSIPTSTNACYTLGMAYAKEYRNADDLGMTGRKLNDFYARFGPNQVFSGNHLKAIKIDVSPWFDDDGISRVVDFNPFSGVALFVGSPCGRHGDSIVVLDFLCTG